MRAINILPLILFGTTLATQAFAQGPGIPGEFDNQRRLGGYCPACTPAPGPRERNDPGPDWRGPGSNRGYRGYYGYGLNEECQKFLSDRDKAKRELSNRRFEYFEATRNPNLSREKASKMEKEIWSLQDKVDRMAPPGCRR